MVSFNLIIRTFFLIISTFCPIILFCKNLITSFLWPFFHNDQLINIQTHLYIFYSVLSFFSLTGINGLSYIYIYIDYKKGTHDQSSIYWYTYWMLYVDFREQHFDPSLLIKSRTVRMCNTLSCLYSATPSFSNESCLWCVASWVVSVYSGGMTSFFHSTPALYRLYFCWSMTERTELWIFNERLTPNHL